MRIKSRQYLRERAQREAHRIGELGDWKDSQWNEAVQIAYDQLWEAITHADEGFGVTTQEFTIGSETPVLNLPDNFLDIRSIERGVTSNRRRLPEWTTPRAIAAKNLRGDNNQRNTDQYYMIEGPGVDYDPNTDTYIEYTQRLRFFPNLEENEVVRLAFVTQPYQFPSGDGGEAETVDVISVAFENVVIMRTILVASRREDIKEFERAAAMEARAISEFLENKRRRNRLGSRTLDSYRRRSVGWIGY